MERMLFARHVKKDGMEELDARAYKAIEIDLSRRFGYFRCVAPRALTAKWWPCAAMLSILEELDGSRVLLDFGNERVLIEGRDLAPIPNALASGIVHTLRAFNADIHDLPKAGDPVITDIRVLEAPKKATSHGEAK